MTTTSFSHNLSHATDTSFNEWAARVSTAFGDAGLVQTADTGQTEFTGSPLHPKPSANTYTFYQIWRFNDSLHTGSPSYPIYIRFEFGSGATASTDAGLRIKIGTGTDGAGNLTGAVGNYGELENVFAPASQTAGPCFVTHSEGMFAIFWGIGGQSVSNVMIGWFAGIVARSVDGTGAPTGDSYFLACQKGNGSISSAMENKTPHESVGVAAQTIYGDNTITGAATSPYGLLPGGANVDNYTDANGDTAVFPAFGAAPSPFPVPQIVFGWKANLPVFSTFTATPVGTTSHTYLTLDGRTFGGSGPVCVDESESTLYVMAIQWE